MTRASVSAQLQRNWHFLTVAGMLLGVSGARLYTDQDREAVKTALTQQTTRIDDLDRRVTTVETALTVLALKACGDTTTGTYEAFNLKCAALRSR